MAEPSGVIIREIEFDPERRDYSKTHRVTTSALLLSAGGRIVLQRRPDNAQGAAGMLGLFGIAQDGGETMLETGVRAIQQALGVRLEPAAARLLGAIEVVQADVNAPAALGISARYFWPIIGTPVMCNEGSIETYRSGAEIMALPNLTKAAEWAIARAITRELIPA